MALVTDNWGLSTLSSTQVSLHLEDNQSLSGWSITALSIDGSAADVSQIAPLTGTHNDAGSGDWTLTLSNDIALSGTGVISLSIDGIDGDAEIFSTIINFSYTVPQITRTRLVGSTGMSRIRLTSSGD